MNDAIDTKPGYEDSFVPIVDADPGDETDEQTFTREDAQQLAEAHKDVLDRLAEGDSAGPDVPADAGTGTTADDPVDAEALLTDLHTWIVSSLDLGEYLISQVGGRELALCITRLQEAEFWLLNGMQPPATPEPTEEVA